MKCPACKGDTWPNGLTCSKCQSASFNRRKIVEEIGLERQAQISKWGHQHRPNGEPTLLNHPGGVTGQRLNDEYGLPSSSRARAECERAEKRGALSWPGIVVEELTESIDEVALGDMKALRKELIHTIAVLVAWVEDLDSE